MSKDKNEKTEEHILIYNIALRLMKYITENQKH